MPPVDVPEVTYCVVNTGQRALLLRGLDAIARERAAVPFPTAVLVLDNASDDGSAQAARAHPVGARGAPYYTPFTSEIRNRSLRIHNPCCHFRSG